MASFGVFIPLAAAAAVGGLMLAGGPLRRDRPATPLVEATVPASNPRVAVGDLKFDAALETARTLPRIRSLLIAVDGHLLAEQYFGGATAVRATNIKSASKSIISTLVGIAIDRGRIPSVHEPLSRYFAEYLRTDPDKAAITIEDLITMRAGLETTSNRNYGRWVQSGHWVRHVLHQPLIDRPGGQMIYSTGSTHLLSAILTKATGASTLAFARSALGTPLGMTFGAWTRDPQGIYLGGNEMAMRPRDLLRIGEMYLNGGRHNGQQVVSEGWVRASLEARTVSRRSNDRHYGYGWWIRTLADRPVFYAWGYGGQFLFLVPSLRTVVVVTSVSEPGSERREHLGAVYDLLERHIIPVAATASD